MKEACGPRKATARISKAEANNKPINHSSFSVETVAIVSGDEPDKTDSNLGMKFDWETKVAN